MLQLAGELKWNLNDEENNIPFILCSDPMLTNLRQKRSFLETAGVGCIVMPCHISNAWYDEVAKGCCVPFLHIGDCVVFPDKATMEHTIYYKSVKALSYVILASDDLRDLLPPDDPLLQKCIDPIGFIG
ncbi:hypothetical protein M9H77_30378 [Catharanthus roseus]|uniref:Uncharacterized protein n=1 Tax=Catharanthus roseus TaxID=4058 RepID=A0ACC0A102_CATRO|nr:hypothetical protein M9H77_30378 [Catharanthus roseus]